MRKKRELQTDFEAFNLKRKRFKCIGENDQIPEGYEVVGYDHERKFVVCELKEKKEQECLD